MAETPAPRLIDHVILPHPSEPRVLLLPGVEGWTLPHWTAESHFWHVVQSVNEAMRARFGVKTTILRWVGGGHDPVTQESHNVYASENHTSDWTPPDGARWVGKEDLPGLTLASPAAGDVYLKAVPGMFALEPVSVLRLCGDATGPAERSGRVGPLAPRLSGAVDDL